MPCLLRRCPPARMVMIAFFVVSHSFKSTAVGFSPVTSSIATTKYVHVESKPRLIYRRSLGSTRFGLNMARIEVKTPSQEEAESMGIREWPQQAKSKGSFVESCEEGKTLVRYVLDGQSTVEITQSEEEPSQTISMRPGSLLEVTGEATLSWEVTSNEMILLTPSFEQVGIFSGVALALVVLLGAHVATS